MTNEEQKIIDLITQNLLSGEPLDTPEIQNWANKNKYNQKLFHQLSSQHSVNEKVTDYANFNPEKDWITLNNRKIKRKRIRFIILSMRSVAAVAVISFLIFTYYPKQKPLNTMAVSLSSIEPGGAKAILKLSNGDELFLNNAPVDIMIGGGKISVDTANLLSYEQTESDTILYNTLKIPTGGEYQMKLCDGTHVWLNSNSEITFPSRFTGDSRSVKVSGEVYFEVSEDKTKPFTVLVDDLAIKVLGTEFNISNYPEENLKITLTEGSITLTQLYVKGERILSPGEQLIKNTQTGFICIREVDVDGCSAWRKGLLYFDNETIEEVARKLERWYSVKIDIRNEELKKREIYGVIKKYENINQIFELLKTIKVLDSKTIENEIIITNLNKS